MMNLSLNFDLLIRYLLCLRGEFNLNGLLKLLMKCNVIYIVEIKMGCNKRLFCECNNNL